MSDAEFTDLLGEVQTLYRNGRATPARDLFRKWLTEVQTELLLRHESAVRRLAEEFVFPKYRAELLDLVSTRLPNSAPKPLISPLIAPVSLPTAVVLNKLPPLTNARTQLRKALDELSRWHIFQWSTFYRDMIGEKFNQFTEYCRQPGEAGSSSATVAKDAFLAHTQEVFEKAVQKGKVDKADVKETVAKSLNGLGRFITLPVERYLSTAVRAADTDFARADRLVCSAMLTGILIGFGRTRFGKESGWAVLLRANSVERWAYTLAFLTGDDLRQVVGELRPNPLADGIAAACIPLASVIDGLLDGSRVLVPTFGEFDPGGASRLTVRLIAPAFAGRSTGLSVLCHMGTSAVSQLELDELADRGVTILIAPVRSDLHAQATAGRGLRLVSSLLSDGEAGTSTTTAIRRHIDQLLAILSDDETESPIPYNYVSDFPLEKPGQIKSYFVPRPSVRKLLSTFEQKTGAHLWCSLRRSGKTTAGFDLSSVSGAVAVVSQTCDSIGLHSADNIFFSRFRLAHDAAQQGRHLSHTFFADAVRAATPNKALADRKTVFVLDEYETLFGHLQLVEDDQAMRFRLVQPLLNQMAAFSRDNLLILLGMQPDAHFILMEQNQLSPLVVQDQFPLFAHTAGDSNSEFRDLLVKAVRMAAPEIDPGFADAMHAETGGHPFLTINHFYEVFDWLLQNKRPARGLRLTEDDYRAFALTRMTHEAVSRSPTYNVMREVIRRALSGKLRKRSPWVYAVFALLRHLARESPESLSLPYTQAVEFLRQLAMPGRLSDPDHLLQMAERANMFCSDRMTVRPRVPLLARLARSIADEIDP